MCTHSAAPFSRGVGQTEQQLQAMADLHPDAYVGTPSFLKILLEKPMSCRSMSPA